jgi:hypothetical protein
MREKILFSVAKYWAMVKRSWKDKLVGQRYEWQVGKLNEERWVGRLQILNTTGLIYPWLEAGGGGIEIRIKCCCIKIKCICIQRQW